MGRIGQDILDLLSAERSAILSGDYDRLSDVEEALERLVRQSVDAAPSRTQIESIKAAAARNADLLRSAIRGVKSAKSRLADIEATKNDFGGYDATGSRLEKSGPSGSLDFLA